MTNEQYTLLLTQLTRIGDSLEKLTAPKQTEVLGFIEPPRAVYLFVGGDSPEHCWYKMDGDKQQPIEMSALSGRVTGLNLVDRQFKSDTRVKLDITVSADREYTIRTGVDSIAAKCLLLSLWKLPPAALKEPLTIALQRGQQESKVVFAHLYQGNARVNYEWQEFDAVATSIALAERINQGAF